MLQAYPRQTDRPLRWLALGAAASAPRRAGRGCKESLEKNRVSLGDATSFS